jgi:hypothetical protein
MAETIKCQCGRRVKVSMQKGWPRIEKHDNCRGSFARIQGNWRDDPTYHKETDIPAPHVPQFLHTLSTTY